MAMTLKELYRIAEKEDNSVALPKLTLAQFCRVQRYLGDNTSETKEAEYILQGAYPFAHGKEHPEKFKKNTYEIYAVPYLSWLNARLAEKEDWESA